MFVLQITRSENWKQKVVGLLLVLTNSLVHSLIPRLIVHAGSSKLEVFGRITEQHVILANVERPLEVVDVSL